MTTSSFQATNALKENNKYLKRKNKILKNNNVGLEENFKLKNDIKLIIDYLNNKANTKFKYNTQSTINLIKTKLNEGYTIQDFYTIIDNKYSTWINTEYMKYFRPSTLFSDKHFEDYLNETNIKQNKQDNIISLKII